MDSMRPSSKPPVDPPQRPMPSPTIAPTAAAAVAAPNAALAAEHKARFWNRIARRYAADPIADRAGYEATLRRVQGLLRPSHDVLEIGCGTGTTALRLAPFCRRLLATDVSAEMIAIAREKLAASPAGPAMPHLQFALADADAPAVSAPGTHDVVLAFNLLHLVHDLDQALAHAAQALRPGGLLISKTPCIADMNPLVRHLAIPFMRAIGKAPPVLCLSQTLLTDALARQGLDIDAVERHGTRGKDFRVFIVARKRA
jgi:SAM-dependent methyltransferase